MQQVRVGAYVMKQKLKGNKRYPLVLMLEPLFKCNLAEIVLVVPCKDRFPWWLLET